MTPMTKPCLTAAGRLLTLSTALLSSHAALAHTGNGVAGGLSSGFLHPLTGPDHLVAMVAVGLWGAQLGNPAIWILPIAFPMVMAFGGLLGIDGVGLPAPELMIALSAVALGSVVALRARAPLWAAALLVAVFAIFHGYAHGKEMPGAADAAAYAAGFVIATGLLHLAGILIGVLGRFPWGGATVRGLGGAITALGCAFLLFGGPG
jgi:urease accessory protein